MEHIKKTKKQNLEKQRIAEGFKEIVAYAPTKFKQYLLRRVGIASHEIRIGIDGESPVSVEEDLHKSFKEQSFYIRAIDSSAFYLLNYSGTSPSITRLGMFVNMPANSPLQVHDPRFNENLVSWEHDFIIFPKEEKSKGFDIPILSPGKYRAFSKGAFSSKVWWPEVIEKYGYHDWHGNKDVPRETGSQMRQHIEDLRSQLEIWIYVELDSQELLPFRWDGDEQSYIPGFWTDGTVVV